MQSLLLCRVRWNYEGQRWESWLRYRMDSERLVMNEKEGLLRIAVGDALSLVFHHTQEVPDEWDVRFILTEQNSLSDLIAGLSMKGDVKLTAWNLAREGK
jgi:hypothetical protein